MPSLLTRDNLHGYQDVMVDFALENEKCAWFVDMGLGKTGSALTVISDLLEQFEIARVLVVGPLRVANTVWAQETEKWAHTQGINAVICTGSEKQRLAALDSEAEMYILNRENVAWLAKEYRGKPGSTRNPDVRKWKWDMVILDESTSFKTHSSKRHRAIKSRLGYIRRLIELTGSPAANGLKDLWGQVYLLDKGERLGHTLGDFQKRYFDYDQYTHEWKAKPWAEEAIFEKISDICLVMEAGDHLDLPETVVNNIYVNLSQRHRKQYETLEEDFYVKLAEMNEEVIALNGAALSNKLLQFANGALITEQRKHERGDDKWVAVHDQKIEALKSVIEEANGHPVLVAYNYKSDLARLKKAFPQGVSLGKDPKTEKLWNQGKIPILWVHPASGGHGLNLQLGSHITCWFGMNWSLEYYEQLNARLGPVRQKQSGTGKTPIVHHIMVRDSVDEVVLAKLESKDSLQVALKKAIKARQSC